MSIAITTFLISTAMWLFVSFALIVYEMVNKNRWGRKEPAWPAVVFIGIPWLVLPVVMLISGIFVIVGYVS